MLFEMQSIRISEEKNYSGIKVLNFNCFYFLCSLNETSLVSRVTGLFFIMREGKAKRDRKL